MKKTFLVGISAVALMMSACGGASAEGEETTSDSTATENEVVEPVVMEFTIDTAETIINWNNLDGDTPDHKGTVSAANGKLQITATGDMYQITDGNLVVDMNSISEGSEKLEGHLMSEDFFDVNQYATTEFMFDRHEDGMIYGTAMIIGKETPIAAPVEVMVDGEMAMIEVGQFEVDFAALGMPFFTREMEEAPEEERHNSNIQFSASVKAMK